MKTINTCHYVRRKAVFQRQLGSSPLSMCPHWKEFVYSVGEPRQPNITRCAQAVTRLSGIA